MLIHDFWAPYDSVLLEERGEHRCCLAHLLRELDNVDEHALPHKSPDRAAEWCAFVKMPRRLLRDGIRLRRLAALAQGPPDRRAGPDGRAGYADPDAARLAVRLHRH